MEISIKDLSKRYGKVMALDHVSLDFEPGQIVVLLGSNGAGKTTLLRCMAGISAPDSGTINYDGEIFRRDRVDLRRRFFFLPDFPFLFPQTRMIRHIGMVLRLYRADAPGVEERVVDLLREFDLLPLAESPMSALSRGQAYKAALCAFIAVDPEVWLLDEPFASGMDMHGLSAFKEHVRNAVKNGRTVIYSTQILDVAEKFSDKACVIHKGLIKAFGPAATLGAQSERGVLEELFASLREEKS
jgi:ABC-type multidrug transport system ATPase subunit